MPGWNNVLLVRCFQQMVCWGLTFLLLASTGSLLSQAFQIWLYHTEPSGIKSEVARGLQSETEFQSTGKNQLAIDFRLDGDNLVIRIE
jgi:hypothetical protein